MNRFEKAKIAAYSAGYAAGVLVVCFVLGPYIKAQVESLKSEARKKVKKRVKE